MALRLRAFALISLAACGSDFAAEAVVMDSGGDAPRAELQDAAPAALDAGTAAVDAPSEATFALCAIPVEGGVALFGCGTGWQAYYDAMPNPYPAVPFSMDLYSSNGSMFVGGCRSFAASPVQCPPGGRCAVDSSGLPPQSDRTGRCVTPH